MMIFLYYNPVLFYSIDLQRMLLNWNQNVIMKLGLIIGGYHARLFVLTCNCDPLQHICRKYICLK